MGVGKSHRTPFKHWILDSELGRIAGVLSTGKVVGTATADPFLIVDLCAGDGTPAGEGDKPSALIIQKHAKWCQQRMHCEAVLIEKSVHTYSALANNTDSSIVQAINGDARDFILPVTHATQAVFVNCDPNHVADMPLTEAFFGTITRATTMVITLGCNVGGLKRLPFDVRREWYKPVELTTRTMPAWHDALLVKLIGDSSCWAYLIRTPLKWSRTTQTTIRRKGEQFWASGVSVVSYRDDIDAFRCMTDELFLTRKELKR